VLVSLLPLGKAPSTSKGTGLAPFAGGQLNDRASPAPADVSLDIPFCFWVNQGFLDFFWLLCSRTLCTSLL